MRSPTIVYAANGHIGYERAKNDDRWFANKELGLFGVADGMGGRQAGSLASSITAEALPRLLEPILSEVSQLADPCVQKALVKSYSILNELIYTQSTGRVGIDGMGTTVVTAILRRGWCTVFHIGDSRAYLYRDSKLNLLTTDHTTAQLLLEAGEITPQEAVEHPGKAQLTRYLGMENTAVPSVSECFELTIGDRLLLCTDGLTGMITEGQLAAILAADQDASQTCDTLIDSALAAGGKDNVTCLVIDVETFVDD